MIRCRRSLRPLGRWLARAPRRRFVLAFAITALAGGPVGSQTQPVNGEGIPRLTFDNLPAAVRRVLENAYADAVSTPEAAPAVGRLAMLLHAHEQLASAESCYRRARALEPGAFKWPYLAGVTQADAGNQVGAIQSFRSALAVNPGYLPARVRLAEALMRAGDLDASLGEYERLVREIPELAIAHYGLGRVASQRLAGGAAIAHFQRAVELIPGFGPAHYALGLAYRDAGNAELARMHLDLHRRWGSRRPALPDALLDQIAAFKTTARDLLADAVRIGEEGRVEEAILRHLQAIHADPGTAAQAHVNLISLYGRSGDVRKAEEHYRAALALGTSLADAHYNYGVLLASTHRRGEAEQAFQLALDANPFHARAHNNLATLLAGQDRLADAVSHYTQAIATDPAHRGARYNLGRILVVLGRPREAIAQFERLLGQEDADTPAVTLALATAWFAADETNKALAYAEEARRGAIARGQDALVTAIDAVLQKMKVKGS